MSLPRLGLVPLWPLLFATATLLGGCASGPTIEQTKKSYELEIDRLRGNHEREVATLKRQLEVAVDEAKLGARKLERAHKALRASRATSAQRKVSLDAALALLKRKEAELVDLRKRATGSKTASQAAPLLLALRKQVKRLRDEIARLKSGEVKPKRPELDGIVTAASLNFDRPVARIDGRPITRRDFVEFLYRDLGAPQLLDLFLNRYLIVREARRRGVKVSNVDAELWVTREISKHEKQAGDAKKLAAKLRQKGFSRKAWEARLKYQAKPHLLLKKLVELNRSSAEGKQAFESRLRAAYQEAYSERVSARHIYFKLEPKASPARTRATLRKARAAYGQLRSGIPFTKVAGYHSDDPKSRKLGGSLGTFDRKKFASLPRLNTALFTLPVKKISPPIRSRVGFHIVLVEKRLPPSKPFDAKVRRKLTERLQEEAPGQHEVEVLLRKLRARARIERALVFD